MPLSYQKEGYVGVYFTREQKEKLTELAKSQNRSLTKQIIWELRHILEEEENDKTEKILHGKSRIKRKGR